MAKLNDLSSTDTISDDDIMHLRTTGGIDKKISGEDLKEAIVNRVVEVSSTQTITLTTETTNLTVIGEQITEITVTFSGTLEKGKVLTLLNPTSFELTYIVNSVSYILPEGDSINYISDGSSLVNDSNYSKQFELFVQYPFMLTPYEVYSVGTWLDISSRAIGYGVSTTNSGDPTLYITREEANQDLTFDDSDLSVSYQLDGGDYDDYYIRSVETYEGDFFRVTGDNASDYNEARQDYATIRNQSSFTIWRDSANRDQVTAYTGSFYTLSYPSSGGLAVSPQVSASNQQQVAFDNNRSVNSNSSELRPNNRSVKIWIRTV